MFILLFESLAKSDNFGAFLTLGVGLVDDECAGEDVKFLELVVPVLG